MRVPRLDLDYPKYSRINLNEIGCQSAKDTITEHLWCQMTVADSKVVRMEGTGMGDPRREDIAMVRCFVVSDRRLECFS